MSFMIYAAKLMAPRGLVMLFVTIFGGLIYQSRMPTGKKPDFVAACFEIYTQLFFEHGESLPNGAPVITGDARRNSILSDAGVENARSLICCTDDDLANLEVALDARKANPNIRLVTRMFEQSMAQKLRHAFALDNTLSTSEIAAPLFAAAALDENVFGAYRLGQVIMVSLEVPVAKRYKGQSVANFTALLQCPLVGVHIKGREPTHLFKSSDILNEGDAVICHVPAAEIASVYERLS